jgi:heptosyltransferase III
MSQTKNILVYRLGSLGDMIIALPCFHLVRKAYPHAKIFILTNQPISGKAAPAMAIFENSGLCDEAISYPVGTRNLGQLAEVRRIIRQLNPQTIINLTASRGLAKSLRDYFFLRSCGAGKIIGTPFSWSALHVPRTADGGYAPESERLAARLDMLGNVDLTATDSWNLGLTQEERNLGAKLVPADQNNFIAVSVGTKLLAKDWGEENWGKFISQLSKQVPGATLLLLGSADEWERSERLGQLWSGARINLCGKTSPRVSAAILEHTRLFIGHDSGPMHLASAVGIPTVGIFSWNNPPGQWFPGHRSWKFIKTHYPPLPDGGWKPELKLKRSEVEGILLLKPEEIFNSALELLKSHQ